MLQMNTFFGGKFCLKSIKLNATDDPMTPFNYQNQICSPNAINCGNGVCVNKSQKCPATGFSVNNSSLGENSVPFGPNLWLNWESKEQASPISSVQLEIAQPCFDNQVMQSGVSNSDDSIYQPNDFWDLYPLYGEEKGFDLTLKPNYEFRDLSRMNKCPQSQTGKEFFNALFTNAS